jgi:hypothetical protein
MNVLLTKLDNQSLRMAKTGQHREGIILQGTVPAGQNLPYKVEVGTAGTIVTMRMSGSYTTLDATSAPGNPPVPVIVDDGICHLRAQLMDTDKNLALYNDFVPLNVLLSPGRAKVGSIFYPGSVNYLAGLPDPVQNYLTAGGGADAAAKGANKYDAQEFTHPFTINSYILMNVKNDARCPNSFAIYFDVIRVTRKTPA